MSWRCWGLLTECWLSSAVMGSLLNVASGGEGILGWEPGLFGMVVLVWWGGGVVFFLVFGGGNRGTVGRIFEPFARGRTEGVV